MADCAATKRRSVAASGNGRRLEGVCRKAGLMSVSSATAARYACKMAAWSLTNLKLQKILYLAHMVFVGRTNGLLLIDEPFEAWDFGPVLPSLYHRVKIFGNSPIRDVFSDADYPEGTTEGKLIAEACEHLSRKSAGELVAMTHWPDGAWAKNYRKGVYGVLIPAADILQEFKDRMAISARK
jgi:uncharacterized phage-associated protein